MSFTSPIFLYWLLIQHHYYTSIKTFYNNNLSIAGVWMLHISSCIYIFRIWMLYMTTWVPFILGWGLPRSAAPMQRRGTIWFFTTTRREKACKTLWLASLKLSLNKSMGKRSRWRSSLMFLFLLWCGSYGSNCFWWWMTFSSPNLWFNTKWSLLVPLMFCVRICVCVSEYKCTSVRIKS